MSILIELTAQEIAALKQATQIENDAEAVTKAAREFLRLRRLRELKAVSGKVELEANWQELEERESRETDFPLYTTDPHFDLITDLKRFWPGK